MNWSRVATYPESDSTKDDFLSITREFPALAAIKPFESGVAMFTQSREFNYAEPYYFYFTPGCQMYCPDLLKKYGAEEWPKPDQSDVKWVAGHADTQKIFD